MLAKSQIKQIFKDRNLKPTKKFGQNFLINPKPIQQMISAAGIKPSDTILEIGPGLGALTQELILTGAKIIAQEKDHNLVMILQEQFKDTKNLKIIEGDAKYNNYKDYKDYKVVANLPYYLTAPIIRQFLEADNPPGLMVFLIQKQVGQRICAKPPRMNLLAVSVQVYATPKIINYVSRKCFWPMPEVDGAIIKITPHTCHCEEEPCIVAQGDDVAISSFVLPHNSGLPRRSATASLLAMTDRDRFFKIVRAGFSQPRKILISNLANGLGINKNELEKIFTTLAIPLKSRAENLAVAEWIKLTNNF